ncbi:MAG: hypothetical protein ACYC2P_13235 [Paludibacteraceae bacterium]
MTTDAPKEKKIRDYAITIIAAIISGLFVLRAAGEGTRLSIAATQTAEARLTSMPTVNANATVVYENSIATQQAFVSTQQVFNSTQQAFYRTSTAIANNISSVPTPKPTQQVPVTNLNNVPTFYNFYSYIIFAWFVFAFSRPLPRQRLFKTIIALVSEPIVFKHSENNQITFYPRRWLEQVAIGIKTLYERLNNNTFLSTPKNIVEKVTGEDNLHLFEQVVVLTVFILMLYADSINILNTLKILGIVADVLPQWLTYYWVALLSGTVVSTIVGIWVIANQKKTAVFRNKISLFSGYFLVISGLGLALIFSLIRYAELGLIPIASPVFLPQAESFILNLLIPINITLSAAIIFPLAPSALIKLGMLLVGTMMYVIGIFLVLVLSVLLLMIDFQFRFLLINAQITFFLTLSPLSLLVEETYAQRKVTK